MPALHMVTHSGTKLGPYEIQSPLGAGGMGEVFRARDPRLGREVAIKVLPDAYASDPERIGRFEREARLLASLNHPNIAAVYGFEEDKGRRFLVLELVEGKTLQELLEAGPLPLRQALPIARQISEALEAAHSKGILHRDLKPANVKVTPEGKVKLLDFGLAKVFSLPDSSDAVDLTKSPTVIGGHTMGGMILGTASYMSPDQARGKPLDSRSDIWSFGCLLYEMLTGRKAFRGETVTDILVAILEREPDWSALPEGTPPHVVDLLRDCLRKNVDRRSSSIAGLWAGLDLAADGRTLVSTSAVRHRPVSWRWVSAVFTVAAAVAVILLVLRSSNGRGSLPDRKYLTVVFKDLSGQAQGQLFVDGLQESLTARLSKVSGLQILPAPGPAGSEADLQKMAKESGANLIVTGSYRRDGDAVRVTYALRSPVTPVQLAADEVSGSASAPFALEDRLFENILGSLRLHLSPGDAARPVGLENADAQEQYLRALGYLHRYDDPASVNAAISLLLEVPKGDDAALVQAALGRAYLAAFERSRDAAQAALARRAIERAATLAPALPEVRVTLGQLLTATGQPKEAVVEIKKALELQPDSADALNALARALDKAGDPGGAEKAYQRATELRSSSWSSFNRLGAFYFATGRYEKAAEAFRTAISLNAGVAVAHGNLGGALLRLDRFDEAEAAFTRSIEIQPSPSAFSNLGTCQYLLGHFEQAAASFDKAATLVPKNFRYRAYLGDALTFVPGGAERAREAYRAALALGEEELRVNPREAATRATLARCHARLGETGKAWAEVQQALALAPTDPNVLKRAAVVAAILGRKTETFRLLGEAVSRGYGLAEIRRDPEFSAFRDDPQFAKILNVKTPS